MCLGGAGSRRQGRHTVKGLWESACLDLLCAGWESVFAFERPSFHTASLAGTVINADVNGKISQQRFSIMVHDTQQTRTLHVYVTHNSGFTSGCGLDQVGES